MNVHYGPQHKWNEEAKKNADILFGASEQSALAITRDHKDRFNEKDIQPLYLRKSILLVKKGNPKNIRSIDDLTRPGLASSLMMVVVPVIHQVQASGKILPAVRGI